MSSSKSSTVKIYTDGACKGGGVGGWAWAVNKVQFETGGELDTTNQRMELTAVIRALQAQPGPVEIVSDSAYVVNCYLDKWWVGWIRNGWRNSTKKPVANKDLWEPLVQEFASGRVHLSWVKGHSGDPMNDFVDHLASDAAFALL